VELLNGIYASYHFGETIDAGGLVFDYRPRTGPATTRNAMALLELQGAPPSLVQHALNRAAALDHERASRAST
jgi:DNA mismatch repair ATPase MutS